MTGLVTLIIVLLTGVMAVSLALMVLAAVWALLALRQGRW
jgi:hypothetical protein